MRTAYDFSPLYQSVIGVDRMADLIDSAMRREGDRSYPPYDVEKIRDDGYRITIAADGFAAGDLEITAQPNLLVVAGHRSGDENDGARVFLHRGITARDFERRFELADYVVVKSASYDNGVLSIDLAREVPEALKRRRVKIGAAAPIANVRGVNRDPAQPRAS